MVLCSAGVVVCDVDGVAAEICWLSGVCDGGLTSMAAPPLALVVNPWDVLKLCLACVRCITFFENCFLLLNPRQPLAAKGQRPRPNNKKQEAISKTNTPKQFIRLK